MVLLEKWTPFPDFDVMDRRMRRFFADLGVAPAPIPAADLYETAGEFVIELEVPGFDREELGVKVFDHTLAVTGERAEEAKKKEEETIRLRERLESRFVRRFELPTEVDSEHIKAEYGKGVLIVHVPKAEALKPRTVEITKV
jgi:HSP20 family protein